MEIDENIYVGTSAAEILHFVCLPAAFNESNEPTFILASRLSIPFQTVPADADQKGVQQITILSQVNKACILCNGTVTFYLLPELSPAFGNTRVNHCSWIGGLDLNRDLESDEAPVVMLAVQNTIMLVQVGEEARRIKQIGFPGCLVAARRGTIACAADMHSYSLLDVEHQQKIPLFPISSSSQVFESRHVESTMPTSQTPLKRSPSSSYPSSSPGDTHVHGRSSSLNTFVGMLQSPGQLSRQRSPSGTPDPFTSTEVHQRSSSEERAEDKPQQTSPDSPVDDSETTVSTSVKELPPLPRQIRPHVVSPTPSEFLLVTGTEESEPGVGIFVDMDGEVVRGTINFHRYPKAIVIDTGEDDQSLQPSEEVREEVILAVIESDDTGELRNRLAIQRWDKDPAEIERQKRWLDIPSAGKTQPARVGLRHTLSPSHIKLDSIGNLLRMVRLKTSSLSPHVTPADPRTQASIEQLQKEKELFESQELANSESPEKGEWEAERNAEEAKIATELGKLQSSLILWSGSQIWRVLKNPLVVQLENILQQAQHADLSGHAILQRDTITDLMLSIQDIEPKNEAEFISLNYVKQKASILLYGDLLSAPLEDPEDSVITHTEQALLNGNLDPRLALLFIPFLRCEVLQGPQGIWIHAGLASPVTNYIDQVERASGENPEPTIHSSILNMIKRFLFSWQQKRGYGSITDENYILDSTDAALLHLLLEQDAQMSATQRATSQTRTELNRLVDNWKGNFERAVLLLEQYKRLYILSRLYQSQKMSRNVLKTWQRIINGELDSGGELNALSVETQMRKYLVKIKDPQLIEEYGSWLAGRNPELAIQVFADPSSRVRLEPADVVALLKKRAPNAVQFYLEYLVFSRNVSQSTKSLMNAF